ncbi:MAG TPA: type II secretion system secretin GspD [Myxococcota bacterium]|nr:type II secretion system secretin GspD [Myxococcota bacterium]
MFERRVLAILASLAAGLMVARAGAQTAPQPVAAPPPRAAAAPPLPAAAPPLPAAAPPLPAASGAPPHADDLVQLDFNDVELAVVIDTIARLTGTNFIYDDRVRGRVTIVSPTKIPVAQAYAVFESVLQVKGFTTVEGPGGSVKIIPIRDAKESNINTVAAPSPTPNRDTFVTRLIPLHYIDAEAITNSLKPLVSKDAAMVAYAPTNTVILTDSASNIRRVLSILEAIDVETYKEELAVIKINHADATVLGQQLADVYGAEVSSAGEGGLRAGRVRQPQVPGQPQAQTGEAQREHIRIITDSRTNSLIVLASRDRIEDIRRLVERLDVPVTGGGRIHVYYLKYSNSDDMADTLNSMLSGAPKVGGGGGGGIPGAAQAAQAQALRAAVTELAEGVTVTSDAPTNSLVIQASQEGYDTLRQVIEKLDIRRPQVLVEALIMEVDVTDAQELGLNGVLQLFHGATNLTIASLSDSTSQSQTGSSGLTSTAAALGTAAAAGATGGASLLAAPLVTNFIQNTRTVAGFDANGNPIYTGNGSVIQSLIRASASTNGTNILSAPHILTSDNEEAEIKIGNNIPIISSRVQSAAGITTTTPASTLATSVNVERQDIGIDLKVTPSISEGESLRLDLYQEITAINTSLIGTAGVGDPNQVGVPLSSRKVSNTVVVADGQTVVIGGLISDIFNDTVTKVPWIGDIPFIGWFFKTTSRNLSKQNLLVFLTPHIVREAIDLEKETIRKREEFRARSTQGVQLSDQMMEEEKEHRERAEAAGIPYPEDTYRNPTRNVLLEHEKKYPLERMREIEQLQGEKAEKQKEAEEAEKKGPRYLLLAAVYRDEAAARKKLRELLDAGFDATIVTRDQAGTLVFEIRVGPYPDLAAANHAAAMLRESFGLSPSISVLTESKP